MTEQKKTREKIQEVVEQFGRWLDALFPPAPALIPIPVRVRKRRRMR